MSADLVVGDNNQKFISETAIGVSEEMSVDGGANKGTPSSNRSVFSSWFSGGTFFDALLMEASQQIGQSILTLPWIFANMGFSLGESTSTRQNMSFTILIFSITLCFSLLY